MRIQQQPEAAAAALTRPLLAGKAATAAVVAGFVVGNGFLSPTYLFALLWNNAHVAVVSRSPILIPSSPPLLLFAINCLLLAELCVLAFYSSQHTAASGMISLQRLILGRVIRDSEKFEVIKTTQSFAVKFPFPL